MERKLFKRLRSGMSKTRSQMGLGGIFKKGLPADDEFFDELEERLVMADVGAKVSMELVDHLRDKAYTYTISDREGCQETFITDLKKKMSEIRPDYSFLEKPSVVMMIGVNGAGKTTTIGKIAGKQRAAGKRVLIAAADTFRAAASEQLEEWANRSGALIISGQDGSDPGAVVYDAVQSAKAKKIDTLLVDTAGRLHNKKNLMDELSKINRIIDREYPDACRETLVVLDATTGQNALVQAREFSEVCNVTGVILTKMDGTAKGGIAVAVQTELGIPVKYIGVGESIDDLQQFDAESFVDALFSGDEEV